MHECCTDLGSIMCEMTADARADGCVRFALDARSAYLSRNWARVFRLLRTASPTSTKFCAQILRWTLERFRKQYLLLMLKSYALFFYFDYHFRYLNLFCSKCYWLQLPKKITYSLETELCDCLSVQYASKV